MLDIQKLINDTIQQKFDSGSLEKAVAERVEDLIREAVQEAFRSWSPFGKSVKDMIAEKVQIDPEQFKFDAYNVMVINLVKEMLDNHLQSNLNEQVKKGMEEILKPFDTTKPVKLSTLVEKFMEGTLDYEDSMQGAITCIIEHSTGSTAGYWQFYLDADVNTSKYSCEIQGMVTKEGEVFSLKMGGQKVEKCLFVGPFYDFERYLFQLYANKVKLECDEESVQTTWDKY